MKIPAANVRAWPKVALILTALAVLSPGGALSSLIPGSMRSLTGMLHTAHPIAAEATSTATLGIRD